VRPIASQQPPTGRGDVFEVVALFRTGTPDAGDPRKATPRRASG
jgi:hypothetical protein